MSSEFISCHHHLTLFILTLLLSTLDSSSQSDQRQILYKFKSTLQTSNSELFTSWNDQTSICNFTGMICNSDNSVNEINLPEQQLTGTLSFESICSINSLEKISLGSNFLYGTITTHLSNCTNLNYLDLGNNSFSGKVLDLSLLSRMEFLNLNLSGFSGQFPWESLKNMSALGFLSLGDNPFDKSSFPLEILNLRKLYTIYLSNCSIEGEIPKQIENLSLLQSFELADNYVAGKIPIGITKLTKLTRLELSIESR